MDKQYFCETPEQDNLAFGAPADNSMWFHGCRLTKVILFQAQIVIIQYVIQYI